MASPNNFITISFFHRNIIFEYFIQNISFTLPRRNVQFRRPVLTHPSHPIPTRLFTPIALFYDAVCGIFYTLNRFVDTDTL